MKAIRGLTAFLLFFGWSTIFAQEDAITSTGSVRFVSEAPLERIAAASTQLKGALQPPTKAFAFSIPVGTFMGFNSDIQRTHFLENYMEHKKFPQATFVGKIIEDVPFDVPGSYPVRAKGQLNIHGIAKERIIKGTLEVTPSGIRIPDGLFDTGCGSLHYHSEHCQAKDR